MENSKVFIQLDDADNVLITRRTITEGEVVFVSGRQFTLGQTVDLGFKIANKNINKGEKVVKCGISIGSATGDIALGDMVHVHNMQSDYVPTYTIQNQNEYEK